jgi:hypothetical protein
MVRGAFNTEIGGLTVGTQYDRAAISGEVTSPARSTSPRSTA